MKGLHIILACFLLALIHFQLPAQWAQVSSNSQSHLYDIHFPQAGTGYAVGYYSTVLKSTDFGNTWAVLPNVPVGDFNAVYFLSDSEGFIGGATGLHRTTDGGGTWSQTIHPDTLDVQDIEFIDSQNGFLAGGNSQGGRILRTSDGGVNWAEVHQANYNSFHSVQFPTPTVGYAVTTGYNWKYTKTTDGGHTWFIDTIQPAQGLSNFEDVYFTDANTGFVVGWYLAACIKTTDGGSNWSSHDSLVDENLYSVFFPNSQEGFAVGFASRIISTTDAGATWTRQTWSNTTNYTFHKVYFPSDTLGFIVGSNGVILRLSKAAGPTGLDEETQNLVTVYPNPASEFLAVDIREPGQWSIVIHDLHGRKVIRHDLKGGHNKIGLAGDFKGYATWSLLRNGEFRQSGKLILE